METEQLQNFNERLSQWVANQGFWFQVRYSMSGSGVKGRALFHLLRMGARLVAFLLVLAVGVWVYLVKRTETARFTEAMENDLKAAFSASDFKTEGFHQSQGSLEITRLAAEGGENTFFDTLEARNLRCKMSLIDGLVGVWQPGLISVARLDMDLRAGTDESESAAKFAEAFFRRFPKVDVNALEVTDATLRWGFSERTKGQIESATLKMQRTDNGWRMVLKGGKFSQNWLTRLDIVSMEILCDPEGLVFEKAELKSGNSTVDFSGLRVTGGERPEVNGVAKVRNLPLEQAIPAALRSFIEGTISADFKVSGSTNSSDGVGFEGHVVLDGSDSIALRERFHILKALSVVDYSRNYHRIDFKEGSFTMKTTGGGMEVTDLKLKAGDLFTMDGRLKVRLPTNKEVQEAVAKGTGNISSPLFSKEDEAAEREDAAKAESSITLKRAAMEARNAKDGTLDPQSLTLFNRLGLNLKMRRIQEREAERMSRMLRYEGMFRITIPKDAFDTAPKLKQRYPIDPASGRIALGVPIDGYLYEITLAQAEELYQQRQN